MRQLRLAILATALAFPCLAHARDNAIPDVARQWTDQVASISAGDDTAARGKAIQQRLDALGLKWREEAFTQDKQQGRNIIADLGGPEGASLLLIGAHYDRVAQGRGATDNASGSAAVLELASALKARPLAKHRVAVAFWDLEEKGLLGSKAHVADKDREKPALYVNFDVFGWGDTLWMMAPRPDAPLAAETAAAAKSNGMPLSAGDKYPPTDHQAFLEAKLPAVSFSLTDADEIKGVLRMYQQLYAKQKPTNPPKIMQVIHSDRDTVAELDPANVPRALKTIEEALRTWDAGASPP